jgi:valyl-tRNA synthetase
LRAITGALVGGQVRRRRPRDPRPPDRDDDARSSAASAEFEFSAAVQAHVRVLLERFLRLVRRGLEVEASGAGDARTTAFAIQDLVLRQTLLLLHPVIPFITEELWHQLGYGAEGTFIEQVRMETAAELSVALQARGITLDRAAVQSVEGLKSFVSLARALKAEHNLASRRDVKFLFTAAGNEAAVLRAESGQGAAHGGRGGDHAA